MAFWQTVSERLQPRPADVNGIDFGSTATKVVRIRKAGEDFALLGMETLPPIDLSNPSSVSIPLRLRARFAAITLNPPDMSVKLLTLPGHLDARFAQQLPRHLGLPDDTTDRVGYRSIQEGGGRAESRVLAAAIPEDAAQACLQGFASGLPAPWSLELAPIAALTAFEMGPVRASSQTAIGLLDFSHRFCTFSIFYRKSLVLLRRFDFGTHKILARITDSLNVDDKTALKILADNAFDISELISDIMQPLFSQLILSKDFIQRRENCTIRELFLIGSLASAPAAVEQIERALSASVALWNPLKIPGLTMPTPLSEEQAAWRFSAAIGTALAVLQENA